MFTEFSANFHGNVENVLIHCFRTTKCRFPCKCRWKWLNVENILYQFIAQTKCKFGWKCECYWNMQISMEMSKIYRFIVSARELHVDSVGNDSSKCRCQLKRPANVDQYVDGNSSSKCQPDMFDIFMNP